MVKEKTTLTAGKRQDANSPSVSKTLSAVVLKRTAIIQTTAGGYLSEN